MYGEEYIKLSSGLNIALSDKVYAECYLNFDEPKHHIFSNMISSGQYYPQIMQSIFIMVGIFKGQTSFKDVFLCSLLSCVFFTLLWFLFKLYKTPGINSICCLFGGTVFKYLPFLIIVIASLAIIGDWKIIIFYLISSFVTIIVWSILFAKLSNVKYNDEVAIYVSKFKTEL